MHLIRHGQASFGAANYDVLSARGEAQATALASVAELTDLDAIYCGPLQRQRDTAARLAEATAAATPIVVDDFAEYPAEALFIALMRAEGPRPPELAALLARPTVGNGDHVMRGLTYVLARWIDRDPLLAHVESFVDFSERVSGAITDVASRHGRGARIAVVTSAGPIGLALGLALRGPAAHALLASSQVRNASISTFVFRSGQRLPLAEGDFSLAAFNSVAHLSPADHTYR